MAIEWLSSLLPLYIPYLMYRQTWIEERCIEHSTRDKRSLNPFRSMDIGHDAVRQNYVCVVACGMQTKHVSKIAYGDNGEQSLSTVQLFHDVFFPTVVTAAEPPLKRDQDRLACISGPTPYYVPGVHLQSSNTSSDGLRWLFITSQLWRTTGTTKWRL